MISREEAKEVYFKYAGEFSEKERVELVHESIKDSIGSCGECKHNSPELCAIIKYVPISLGGDWFCADFERKES